MKSEHMDPAGAWTFVMKKPPCVENKDKGGKEAVIPTALELAVQQLPRHKETITTLFRQKESFRSLCQDLHDCTRAMEYWCGSPPGQKNARGLCEEYRVLCEELKKEMKDWLAEHDPGA